MLQVFGVLCVEFDVLPRRRVCESEPFGVQPLPLQPKAGAGSRVGPIHCVANARMPLGRHVHPDLMGSARLECHFKE